MAEVQLQWHSSTTFIEIVAYLGDVVPDGSDADAHPDLYTGSGTVTLSLDTPGGLLVVKDSLGHERLAEFKEATYVIQEGTGVLVDQQSRAGLFVPAEGVEPTDRTMSGEIVWKSGKRTKVGPFRLVANQEDGKLNLVRTIGVEQAAVSPTLAARVAVLEAGGGGGGGLDTEAVQDIVGSMVTGAGGTYDDAAGTITLMSSSDGLSWSSSANTIIAREGEWDSKLYRPTLAVKDETWMRVWYSAHDDGTPKKWHTGYTQLPRSLWPTPPA